MVRIGILLLAVFMIGCGNSEADSNEQNTGSAASKLRLYFPDVNTPYELSDEDLAKKDKISIPAELIDAMIPDSVKQQIRGKGAKLKYQGLGRVPLGDDQFFLLLKAVGQGRDGAHIIVADKQFNYLGYIPFLQVDRDGNTTQVSTIDERLTITRSLSVKKKEGGTDDGKDVYAWDKQSNSFTWVMTDKLEEDEELINPIDTFGQTHKLAGDYIKDKKNKVFIRDGKYARQLLVYIHTEKGECRGELRGYFLLTSSNTAIYKEPGDPCVLELKFSGSSVTLSEKEGCGNYRGLDCPFTSTFSRKKKAASSKREG